MTIKFGTSGWRDIMAEGFTFGNLRICTQAISEQIFKEKNHNKPVVVGYDTRFLSEKYAEDEELELDEYMHRINKKKGIRGLWARFKKKQ